MWYHYRTVYLMTQVVSGQFLRIENIQRGAIAKHDCKEPKEHHSSTKGELGYTLIPMHLACLEYAGEFRGLEFSLSFLIIIMFFSFVTKNVPSHFLCVH